MSSHRRPIPRVEPLEDRFVPALDNTFVLGITGGAFPSTIRVVDGFTNIQRFPDFIAFVNYGGAMSVATGDVNNDGVGDVIVAAQNNMGHIKGFDGETQELLYS